MGEWATCKLYILSMVLRLAQGSLVPKSRTFAKKPIKTWATFMKNIWQRTVSHIPPRSKQEGHWTYKVTLKRVLAAIFVVEKK